MRTTLVFGLLVTLAASLNVAVEAAPVITVYPSVAPNAFGSPNYPTYEANAIAALQSGVSSLGTSGTPSYYSQVPNGGVLPMGAFTVTNFNSWLGDANPVATFGPGYANEYGNRVHFGLHIVSDVSAPFSISQLALNLTYHGSMYADGSVLSYAPGAYQYTSGYVGLNYGPDGIKGTPDDIWIDSGLNTQLVHELFGRGTGLGYEVLTSFPGATNQEKIDQYNSAIWGSDPFTFTATYTLDGVTGSAFVAFNQAEVPEPASLAVWGLVSMAGAAYGWRKRKSLIGNDKS